MINTSEIQNKIINADCLQILNKLPQKCIDLVLTDIPYGVVNRESNGLRELDKGNADIVEFDLQQWLKQIVRVCKGSVYIFCGTEQVSEIRKFLVESKYSTRLIIWQKTNPSPMNGDKIWLSGVECCVYGKLSGATFNQHCKNTVFRYPVCSGKQKIHPTQKPLQLFKYLIQASSNYGDVVLDTFSGSGTTAIACSELDRKFICIEKDVQFYNLSVERLTKLRLNEIMRFNY